MTKENEEKEQRLRSTYVLMHRADLMLNKAANILADFGTDVPPVPAGALRTMAEKTDSIHVSNEFIRSFVRLSVLKQIVPTKKGDDK